MLYIKNIPKEKERLARREIKALNCLKCEYIPTIYATSEDETKISIWMTHFDGRTLAGLVKNGFIFTPVMIAETGIQLCRILRELHDREEAIYHLDIHPDNIIVSYGHVRLVDFGNSLFAGDSLDTGNRWGTPYFSAPELYDSTEVDHRADIYSVGKVLMYLWDTMKDEDKQRNAGEMLLSAAYRCTRYEPENRIQKAADLESILHMIYNASLS